MAGAAKRLGVSQILERVPEIGDYARIQTEQITQAKSGNIGASGWLRLSKRINEIPAGSRGSFRRGCVPWNIVDGRDGLLAKPDG
jgi:L-asparaginase/Glu-tRNA(Gln) amidotransferase subunit D